MQYNTFLEFLFMANRQEHGHSFVVAGRSLAWERGCFVSTVDADKGVIGEYIRNQEREDKRLDQLSMF